MKTTLFKIVVPASGGTPAVPNTGVIHNVESGSQNAIIIPIVFAMLAIAIVAIITLVMLRKNRKFSLRKSSTGLSLAVLIMFGVLSLVGGAIYSGSRASATEITPDFSTSGTVEVEAELDEEDLVWACGTDTITIDQDLPGGYNLFMQADDMVNESNEEAKIVPAANFDIEEPLTDGTWGYWVVPDLSGLPSGAGFAVVPEPVPSTSTQIINMINPVAAGYTQEINYCAVLGPDTEPGTYVTTIKYDMTSDEGPTYNIMQEVDRWGDELEVGEEIQAQDIRDEKLYFVTKLEDGSIWMTQNLDHDIVDEENFYNHDNTDIGYGDTVDEDAVWTGVPTRNADDDEWDDSGTTPESYDPGDLCWNGEFAEAGNYDGGLEDFTEACDDDNAHYHIGNYYNWTAAIATSDSTSYSDGDNANQSICPAGWRLPLSTDFEKIITDYSLTAGANGTLHGNPFHFTYSGTHNGSYGAVGNGGGYWTSVANGVSAGGNQLAYRLMFYDDIIASGAEDSRYVGFPIRCIAR